MIEIYSTKDGITTKVDAPVKGCWINMVNPNEREILEIADHYMIQDLDDLKAALDDEESSRIDVEDNYTLIIVDIPSNEERNGKRRFVTIPLGIILTEDAIITVCLENTSVLQFNIGKRNSIINTSLKTRMLLQILLASAREYIRDLKIIFKQSEDIEKVLHESTENPALIDMMELGKSLLYFTTSLKGNSIVLDKLRRNPNIKKFEEDEELMDDVLVEFKQAQDTTEIYSGLINGTMDAYASVIGNNMNVIQKVIAVITIVLSIPALIFDFYGMNIIAVGNAPFVGNKMGPLFVFIFSIVASILTIVYLKKKKII